MMSKPSDLLPVFAIRADGALAFLRDTARRRDSADVVLRHPDNWPGVLVRERVAWGDDGVFVMRHIVIREDNVITFERVDRGSA
jgi:hypothetical protein